MFLAVVGSTSTASAACGVNRDLFASATFPITGSDVSIKITGTVYYRHKCKADVFKRATYTVKRVGGVDSDLCRDIDEVRVNWGAFATWNPKMVTFPCSLIKDGPTTYYSTDYPMDSEKRIGHFTYDRTASLYATVIQDGADARWTSYPKTLR